MKKITILGLSVMMLGWVSVASAADVKAIYKKECTKCHGDDGKGQTKMGKKLKAKDYTDPKVQAEMKDDVAFKAIKEGLKEDGKTLMKPAKDVTDDDIKALIAFMRAFKK